MNRLISAVPGTPKPTLISAEDFFMEARSIHCLIQTKELRGGREDIREGVWRVGDRRPGAGKLIRVFQGTPTVPTDHHPAIGNKRISQCGRGTHMHHRK